MDINVCRKFLHTNDSCDFFFHYLKYIFEMFKIAFEIKEKLYAYYVFEYEHV